MPIDFSRPSLAALRWARVLARRSGMRVVAVHAIAPTMLVGFESEEEVVVDRATARLEELLRPLAGEGTAVEVACMVAEPADAVRREAARARRPIVVMGNRGLTRMRRVFLGSVTDRVERTVDCPVLVVHEDDDAPGTEARRTFRAVVGVDFHADGESALAAFRALAVPLLRAGIPVEATLVHVLPPTQFVDGADVPIVYTPDFGALEEETTGRLSPVARSLRADGIAIRIEVRHGDPALRIRECARALRADLVVVGRHAQGALARALLGSTADRVLHGAQAAVLTSRRSASATPPMPQREGRVRIIA